MNSLKTRVLLTLLCVLILYGVVDFGIHRFILFPSFLSLERDEAIKNAKRCKQAIARELHHLDSLCHDWGAWNDTYEFMYTGSKEFEESELILSAFTNNKLNLIYFCDTTGRVVWGEIHDLETTELMDIKEFSKDSISLKHPLLQFQTDGIPLVHVHIAGIITTEKGPMLISSRPIVTGNNEGPMRGAIFMGRLLNKSIVGKLVEQTQVDFQIVPVDQMSQTIKGKRILKNFSQKSEYYMETDDENLEIFTWLPDINGKSAFLIKAKIPRKIVEKGMTTLRHSLYPVFLIGIVMLALIMIIFQFAVLRPVKKLINHVLTIEKTGDLSVRLSLKRQDEIGMLASAFDRMVMQLGKRNSELAEVNKELKSDIKRRKQVEKTLIQSEKKYRLLIDDHSSPITLFTLNGTILLINTAGARNMGSTPEGVTGKSLCDIFPEFVDTMMERNRIIAETGEGKQFEDVMDFPDGKKWLLSTLQPVKNSSGEIFAIQCISYDMTEKKKAEEEINNLNKKLEGLLKDRTAQLRDAQDEIVQKEYKSELSDITTGTLHNVRNILNSVKISSEIIEKNLSSIPFIDGFRKANEMLREKIDFIEDFISHDPKGKKLMQYYLKLDEVVDQDMEDTKMHLKRLKDKVDAIEQIISAQQGYVGNSEIEEVELASIVEDALTMQTGILESYNVKIIREFFDVSDIHVQKTKLMHILINLIKNAKEAMLETPADERVLTLNIKESDETVVLKVGDSGHGISQDNMEKMFKLGFTTKTNGHGFGLHSCHQYVTEMGAEMAVESDGEGKGATFILKFPITPPSRLDRMRD